MNQESYESFTFDHDVFIAGLYVGLRDDYAPAHSRRKEHHD
jgi:hypothetical protein